MFAPRNVTFESALHPVKAEPFVASPKVATDAGITISVKALQLLNAFSRIDVVLSPKVTEVKAQQLLNAALCTLVSALLGNLTSLSAEQPLNDQA